MSTRKWRKAVEKLARSYGLVVEMETHLKIRTKEGKLIATCAANPSDHRALKNVESTLRNAMKEEPCLSQS